MTVLLAAVAAGRTSIFRPPFASSPADAAGATVTDRLVAFVQLPVRIMLWTAVGTLVLAGLAWYERRPLVRPSRLPGTHDGEDLPGLVRRVAAIMTAGHLPLLVGIPVPVLGFVVVSMLQAAIAVAAASWLLRWSFERAGRWVGLTVLAIAASLLASHGLAWVLGPVG